MVLIAIIVVHLLLIGEISQIAVHGWYLSNKKLAKIDFSNIHVFGESNVIKDHNKKTPPIIRDRCLTSKYRIRGMGIVPRWSKYTKLIDEVFKQEKFKRLN